MAALRVSLEQWRALVAVVDGGSYSRAADALHKSQSSITYALQQLESELGVEAFKIEGRKAVLTPTGQLLYRRARYLLDELAQLEGRSAQRLSAGWEANCAWRSRWCFRRGYCWHAWIGSDRKSPNTRIEVIESIVGHRSGCVAERPGRFGHLRPAFQPASVANR